MSKEDLDAKDKNKKLETIIIKKCKVCGKPATHMHNVHDSWSSNPHSEYVPLCDDCWHQ